MFKAIEFIEKLIWLRFLWSILSHSSILAYTALVFMDYVQELQTMFPENEEVRTFAQEVQQQRKLDIKIEHLVLH